MNAQDMTAEGTGATPSLVSMANDRWARWGSVLMQGGALLAPLGLLLSVGILYASFALLALGAVMARARIWQLPGFWWWLAFAAWMTLITLLHGYRFRGIIYAWPLVYLIAIGMSFPFTRRWAPWLLVLSLTAAGTLALLQFTIGLGNNRPFRVDPSGEQWQRAVGFFAHHIRFGTVMAVVAILFTVRLGPQLPRWLGPSGASLAVALCLISSARGQLLALLAGLWLRFMSGGWRRFLISGFGVLVIAGLGLLFLQLTQPERLARLWALDDVRWTLWSMCVQLWAQAPVLGIGVGLNEALLAHFGEDSLRVALDGWIEPGHAHNSFLSVGMNYGIPALLLFFAWLFFLLRGLWSRCAGCPVARSAILAVVTVFLVGGMTEDLIGLAYSRFSMVVGIGWLWAVAVFYGTTATTCDPGEQGEAPPQA